MEAIAEPGKAYLTEAAAELARGFFDLRDLGEFEVRGSEPTGPGLRAGGVGAARSRVGIVTEASIGKSRLCHEFAERTRAGGLEVFEAQAQAHARDLRSLALLRMLRSGRPGLQQKTSEWIAGGPGANRLADESGDDYLRVAIKGAGAFARLCAGEFDEFEREADEVLELAGDDPGAGAGIIMGCPVAWAVGAKAIACRERGEYDEADRHLERAIRIAEAKGDPETTSWHLGTKALLIAMRGEAEAGVAVARRNREQTERLGDVFFRSLALGNLGATLLAAGPRRDGGGRAPLP
jgi:tetratricopeptide (TPR) repeat protein